MARTPQHSDEERARESYFNTLRSMNPDAELLTAIERAERERGTEKPTKERRRGRAHGRRLTPA